MSGAAPCARLRGLTPGQVGVCRARGEVMESVRKAAEMVIEEVRSKNLKSQSHDMQESLLSDTFDL